MSKMQKMHTAPRWVDPRAVGFRQVPDPSMTDAEFFHQRRLKTGATVGKVTVAISMIELIGGLARIRDRTEAQEAAAAKYRMLHERAQLGGSRAIDYTAAKVDMSGQHAGDSADYGEDARRQHADAVRHLGMMRSRLVDQVVVHDRSISAIAGGGARARARTTADLLSALDALAVHFKLASSAAA